MKPTSILSRTGVLGVALSLTLTAHSRSACADVKLPAIFGSHMVLQQGRKVPIWGTAEDGEKGARLVA